MSNIKKGTRVVYNSVNLWGRFGTVTKISDPWVWVVWDRFPNAMPSKELVSNLRIMGDGNV